MAGARVNAERSRPSAVIRVGEVPASFIYLYATLMGLVGGSFINVVIYRVPRNMSLVRPGSHCPHCGAPVRFYDNVPLLSYLWLRGKARCCRTRISARYPTLELLSGVLGFAVAAGVLTRVPADTSLARAAAVFAADLIFALALVAAAFIDLEHMYVPDAITLGGTIFALATFSLRPALGFLDAVLGAAIGFVMIWLPFGVAYKWIRGRTGMGLGDAKLVMLAGAWFGWPGAVFALLAGAVQGTVGALVLLALRGRIDEPEAVKAEKLQMLVELERLGPEERAEAEALLAKDPLYEAPGGGLGLARIAFGPFLALAMLEYLLIGGDAVGDYLRWLGLSA